MGEVRRFRKVRLTESGMDVRGSAVDTLLISDGVVKEFAGQTATPRRAGKAEKRVAGESLLLAQVRLSDEGEALAARLKEWADQRGKKTARAGVLHNARSRAGRCGPCSPGESTGAARH